MHLVPLYVEVDCYPSSNQQNSLLSSPSVILDRYLNLVPPTHQRKPVWALQTHPYLPFILNSPLVSHEQTRVRSLLELGLCIGVNGQAKKGRGVTT